MQHIYRIKSSQTWTCPQAGAWKVICVGGGASGGITFGTGVTPIQQAGGTTSFGSLLSALGGQVMTTSVTLDSCGGYGGWDGINYGGSPSYAFHLNNPEFTSASLNGGTLGCAEIGFGAGGGFAKIIGSVNFKLDSNTNEYQQIPYAVPGKCGELVDSIFDLTANQSVACTIGTSAKPTINAEVLLSQIKKVDSRYIAVASTDFSAVINSLVAGTSGIIYLEYLG